jgi:hypothetical protein
MGLHHGVASPDRGIRGSGPSSASSRINFAADCELDGGLSVSVRCSARRRDVAFSNLDFLIVDVRQHLPKVAHVDQSAGRPGNCRNDRPASPHRQRQRRCYEAGRC